MTQHSASVRRLKHMKAPLHPEQLQRRIETDRRQGRKLCGREALEPGGDDDRTELFPAALLACELEHALATIDEEVPPAPDKNPQRSNNDNLRVLGLFCFGSGLLSGVCLAFFPLAGLLIGLRLG